MDGINGIYYAKAAAYLGAAFAMGFGALGPALGQGMIGKSACENIGKYSENSGKIQTAMFIACGLVETSAIYCLLISGGLIMVGWMLK